MRYLRWTFWTLLTLIAGIFLHYTLPQHDVVRIVGTYQERTDLGDWTRIFWSTPDDQSGNLTNRDVQFIRAVKANGRAMVYRNEDTGWRWPPYFKFDTATLGTEADDLRSTAEAPKWAVVTHYGWRSELISIHPNAVAVRAVDRPDVTIIPWFNIFFLVFAALVVFLLRRMWLQFWERTVDPVMANAEEAWDAVDARADAARARAGGLVGRLGAWFASWSKPPRR